MLGVLVLTVGSLVLTSILVFIIRSDWIYLHVALANVTASTLLAILFPHFAHGYSVGILYVYPLVFSIWVVRMFRRAGWK
jgi:hypothetical protein